MPTNKTNKSGEKGVRHLTSSDPVIYFIQALIAASILFVFAYLVFLMVFGEQYKTTTQRVYEVNGEGQDIYLTDDALSEGVDESMFSQDVSGEVDEEKLKNLFPEIKVVNSPNK